MCGKDEFLLSLFVGDYKMAVDLAGAQADSKMQGVSLVPLLKGNKPKNWRNSLYYHYHEGGGHGVARHEGVKTARHKLIHFFDKGEWELFDLKNDPDETTNLATNPNYECAIRRLDDLLLSVVNYRQVAQDVAEYTHTSLGTWVNTTSDWKNIVQTMGWAFAKDVNASIKAIEAYLEGPPRVHECRSERVWPPPSATAAAVTS